MIIITLVEGQNFTVPEGAPDKVEATVFAEARFDNESILRSDPIKLVNSNPEFVTELAWQLDKRSLHQLKVERRAIKLQIFVQTREKRRAPKAPPVNNIDQHQAAIVTRGQQMETMSALANNDSQCSPTNKIELIGYTVIDIRTAQESEQPRYQWLPLLNPKFRKSSYNRPEIQLALSLNRIDENGTTATATGTIGNQAIKLTPEQVPNDSDLSSDFSSITNNLTGYQDMTPTGPSSSRSPTNGLRSDDDLTGAKSCLYRTCLDDSVPGEPSATGDFTAKTSHDQDEIIENDIQIIHKDNNLFIYDTKDPKKFTIGDCKERYKVTITIPFHSDLDLLIRTAKTSSSRERDCYYFSVNLFGTTLRSEQFDKLTTVETNELQFNIVTTDYSVLATYFSLNSCLVIKLHQSSGASIGLTTIHLDQLCSLIGKSRSIEGIFALEPMTFGSNNESRTKIHPTIGVSVSLEKMCEVGSNQESQSNTNVASEMANGHQDVDSCVAREGLYREHFGDDIETILSKSMEDINNRTFDVSNNSTAYFDPAETFHTSIGRDLVVDSADEKEEDRDEDEEEQDRHFCFTIDLKNFSYTQDQRLIPTLRELVVRYSYQFFGYKDTITTDASIPISPTNSIIVSGFCEFNFATSFKSLLTALKELPLNLDILTCEQMQPKGLNLLTTTGPNQSERIVATCNLNLAEILALSETSLSDLKESISKTFSAPIYSLDGDENGQLLVYLSLKDLGPPAYALNTDSNLLSSEPNRGGTIANGFSKNDSTLVRSRAVSSGLEDSTRGSSFQLDGDSQLKTERLDAFIEEAKTSIELWKDKYATKLFEETRAKETERLKRIQQRLEAREARREHEFKKRLDELTEIERRHSNALDRLESFEKVLATSFDQLKSKDALLDSRFDMLDLKLSKAINEIRLEADRYHYQKSLATYPKKLTRSTDDNYPVNGRHGTTTAKSTGSHTGGSVQTSPVIQSRILSKPLKSNIEVSQLRRSSVRISLPKNTTSIPVRSASLVTRATTESTTGAPKRTTVARPVRIQSIVINEMLQSQTSRPTTIGPLMPRPSRLNLPKEIQDKIASLRREKAELLRRGCKPSDDMIQDINSRIERLVS